MSSCAAWSCTLRLIPIGGEISIENNWCLRLGALWTADVEVVLRLLKGMLDAVVRSLALPQKNKGGDEDGS